MLPVATIFGFAFPMVIALFAGTASSGDTSSAIVGRAYAANTVGSIVGSLAAGFWLVPSLGSFRVIAAAAGVNFLLAAATSHASHTSLGAEPPFPRSRLPCGIVFPFVQPFALFVIDSPLWNDYQGRLTLNEIAATSDLVFAKDGINDSVAVSRSDNYVALRINGKVDASTGDVRTQLLLGHLGAVVRADRRDAFLSSASAAG